jgi:hypothetical protein
VKYYRSIFSDELNLDFKIGIYKGQVHYYCQIDEPFVFHKGSTERQCKKDDYVVSTLNGDSFVVSEEYFIRNFKKK